MGRVVAFVAVSQIPSRMIITITMAKIWLTARLEIMLRLECTNKNGFMCQGVRYEYTKEGG